MLLNSRVGKLNFSSKSRLSIVRCTPPSTPPPTPVFPRLSASSSITPQDITYAIEEAKEASKVDPKMAVVKWDIVHELWTHYQRQQDRKNIYDKLDALDVYCSEDIDSVLECREYDL